MRTKLTIRNTVSMLIYQVVTAVCGFILPHLILEAYGSKYNGMVASITQFIRCVVLLRSGIGGVTRVALYKALVDEDNYAISRIMRATELFMHKVARIFVAFLIVFALIYPILVKNDFVWWQPALLVVIIGLSTFIENYFGITYQILLEADQKKYVYVLVTTVSIVLNTAIAALLIRLEFSIFTVKLASALIFSINPLFLYIYTIKKYRIDKNVTPDFSMIEQRWNAFAIQLAVFVNENTDIVVLTVFSNVLEISVYSVYHMIVIALYNLENALCGSIGAVFGDMIAREEKDALDRNVKVFEVMIYSTATVLFTCAARLILPFVEVYTFGINDVNYIRNVFAYLMCINYFLMCIRLPYVLLVEAAGRFREMRNGAILEASLNIAVSIVFVIKYGVIGVAIGTFVASIYRTFNYIIYVNLHILKRRPMYMYKYNIVSIIEALLIMIFTAKLNVQCSSYFDWMMAAIPTFLISCGVVGISSYIIFKSETIVLIDKAMRIFKKGTHK